MKKTPLVRKTSLRDSYLKKLKANNTGTIWSVKNQIPKRKKPLKKVSRAQRNRLKKYYTVRNEFLAENPSCQICVCLGINPPNQATEAHHIYGRAGKNISDKRGFCACCRSHRDWPHEHPREAREMGILAQAPQWNSPIAEIEV